MSLLIRWSAVRICPGEPPTSGFHVWEYCILCPCSVAPETPSILWGTIDRVLPGQMVPTLFRRKKCLSSHRAQPLHFDADNPISAYAAEARASGHIVTGRDDHATLLRKARNRSWRPRVAHSLGTKIHSRM
jgi:hypothetical protein